jgi:hypothetical protein
MSERLHPEVHPDADSLSAFVEGVLPEHERAECLAHLAECSRCREVVFLAQAAPARRRWLRPMPVLAAAAVLCVALLGAWLYLRSGTQAPAPNMVAQAPQASSPSPDKRVDAPAPRPVVRKRIPRAPRRSQPSPAPVTTPEAARTAPVPPIVESAVSIPPAPQPPPLVVETELASAEVASGIFGVVTDPSGASVPQATVQLRQIAGNSTTTARTDVAGQFKFRGLSPGQYELQIAAPGFRQTSQRVEVRPQEVAAVKSELQVGSVMETVQINAAPSAIQTEMSSTSRRMRVPPEPRPLPSKLQAEIMVTRRKVILAVDSSSALFFSGNSGKSWKAVKPQWPGKVARLVTPPELPQASKAVFQLTTDTGSIWLSRDGRHWYSAP